MITIDCSTMEADFNDYTKYFKDLQKFQELEDSPSLLDAAIDAEHLELYPTAIGCYLHFHLWINSLPEKVKEINAQIHFISELYED